MFSKSLLNPEARIFMLTGIDKTFLVDKNVLVGKKCVACSGSYLD